MMRLNGFTRVIGVGVGIVVLCLLPVVDSVAAVPAFQAQNCPEGHLLFFRNQGGIDEIWTITLPGGSPLGQIITPEAGISASFPAWSGAAGYIAFTGTHTSGYQDIYLADRSGAVVRNLTGDNSPFFQPTSRERQPAWSPDGTRIAFAADNGGDTFDLWSIRPDGTEQQRLTDKPNANEYSPTWSPDGTRIAYVSDENGYDEIRMRDLQSGAIESLLAGSLDDNNFAPAWSPTDNTWIAFTRRDSSGSKIYLVNLSDRQPQRLTVPVGGTWSRESWPAWSSDGRFLVFAATPALNSQQPATFDLYLARVFDDTGSPLFPVDLQALCHISFTDLDTSDEFSPNWFDGP